MIKSILLRLKIAEYITLIKVLLIKFASFDLTFDADLVSTVSSLEELCEKMELEYEDYGEDSNLGELDGVRDDRHRSLYYAALSATLDSDEAVKVAGFRVLDVLNHHGGLSAVSQSMAVQTALTSSIARDLNTPQFIADLELIHGGTHKLDALKNSELLFEQGKAVVENVAAERKESKNGSELKYQAHDILQNDLILHLNLKMRKHPDQYHEIHRAVKESVDQALEIYKRRITMQRKKEETPNNER